MTENACYGMAKEGVLGLTRAGALEWAKYNIQVNAIAPLGATDMWFDFERTGTKEDSVDYDTPSLTRISEVIDEGGLKPLITDRIAVKDLKHAHETYLQGKNNGKILVIVDDSLK